MRVGVLGGTFDPVHNGHLAAARAAGIAAALDEVVFIPVGIPGHRQLPVASSHDRLAMVALAIAADASAHAPWSLSEMDAVREGPTYTVNTLADVHAQRPDDELFFILGRDAFGGFHTWRDPGRVSALATLIVVGRDVEGAEDAPSASFEPSADGVQPTVIPVSLTGYDISATDIRQRIAAGEPVDEMVPAAVVDYIRERGVYS